MSDFLAIILTRSRNWRASCERWSLSVIGHYIRKATAYLVKFL